MKRGTSIGIAATLLTAGFVTLVGLLVAHRAASRADHWVQARATVERMDGAKVTYRYETAGGAQQSVGEARPNDRYAPGTSVLVYVDPADPAQSLLQLPPRPPMWPAAVAVLALIGGVAMAVYAWMEGREKQAPKPPVRKPAPPLSRLRPPPSIKRT